MNKILNISASRVRFSYGFIKLLVLLLRNFDVYARFRYLSVLSRGDAGMFTEFLILLFWSCGDRYRENCSLLDSACNLDSPLACFYETFTDWQTETNAPFLGKVFQKEGKY